MAATAAGTEPGKGAESDTGARNASRPNGRRRAVSRLLADFAKEAEGERIRLGDLVRALAHRGHGLLLLVFALPSLVPVYLPGLGAIFGLPLAIISTQMLLGQRQPWLPKPVLDRSLARADYERLIGRAAPWLAKLERLLKPRLVALTTPLAQRLVGLLCLSLSLLLALPVPFTNIPLSLPIALMGLALIAHDGLLLAIAAALGAAALGVTLAFGGKALGAAWNFVVGLAA